MIKEALACYKIKEVNIIEVNKRVANLLDRKLYARREYSERRKNCCCDLDVYNLIEGISDKYNLTPKVFVGW